MATRFYFRENSAAPVSVAVDAAWESSAAPFATGTMFLTTDAGDTILTISGFTSTAGQERCHRQWVSEEMAAGKIFDTSVSYKCQVIVRQSAANDNLASRAGVRIVSSDGGTVRHTVLAVADYDGTAAEWATVITNRSIIDSPRAGVGSYTTVTGDRLVLEVGHADDGAGVSIEGRSSWGSANTTPVDLPEDNIDTTLTKNPWFEVSLDDLFVSTAREVLAQPCNHQDPGMMMRGWQRAKEGLWLPSFRPERFEPVTI